MIDPRFAGAGAVPFAAGYGAQQAPFYQHRHRHHHHHKNKHGGAGDSPVSRDESIHKVDHGHHQFQQNEVPQFGGGFGVPYGAAGFHQQQQQFAGGNYGYGNQYQGNVFNQGQFGGGAEAPVVKHRRRHHRHHRHQGAEGANAAVDQAQGVPEQLIGQRSSSVLGNDRPPVQSPKPPAEGLSRNEQNSHHHRRHHRRHHHHQSGEQLNFGQSHQSHQSRQGQTSAAADGYGHINDELIFIERGEHSPHRQEPPPGYEYKGKIEVQNIEKEQRQTQGQSFVHPPGQHVPPTIAPSASLGPCPPGWQQIVLSAAPGGPCPPGGAMYTGQFAGSGGIAQAGLGGIGSFAGGASGIGFGGVGPVGSAGAGAGLDSLAANLPFPPQGQLIADYIVEANAGGIGASGGISASGGSGFATDFQQTGVSSGGFTEQQGQTSSRATIIEVWQKRGKSTEARKKSPAQSRSRSPKTGSSFDFDRFRNEILSAIERMAQPTGAKIQWTGHDGGTQTQIHQTFEDKKDIERRPTGGEVRVIVQPIQPVFYMPRQNETAAPQVGPGPAIQQTSGGAQIVYVPRNVYVPVIKPVFVPRERVIVRPQVIHVARPVLVDRPVPVTQRPIIIDRERPIPVPVRGAGQAAQGGSARATQEEYVYRDNLPVAYGGRYEEQVGGTNYGYVPSQHQEHQYAASSTHEAVDAYQTQAPVVNVGSSEQYQHSQSASQLNLQQDVGSFHGSYSNLARTNSASAVPPGALHCTEPFEVHSTAAHSSYQSNAAPTAVHSTIAHASYQSNAAPIEVLDATVNPNWQRTDQSSLVRRYGRPAYDIVQRTDQVEQQMYQELRQRSSSGGIQRSASAASYGSGSGVGINSSAGFAGGAGFASGAGSYSSLGEIQTITQESAHYQSSSSQPVCVNY